MIPVQVQINSMKKNNAGQGVTKANEGQGTPILDTCGQRKSQKR